MNVGWHRTVISDSIRHYLLRVSWSFFWQPKVFEIRHLATVISVKEGSLDLEKNYNRKRSANPAVSE